jgi:hypothetical protein
MPICRQCGVWHPDRFPLCVDCGTLLFGCVVALAAIALLYWAM